jgi:hypothetical protein
MPCTSCVLDRRFAAKRLEQVRLPPAGRAAETRVPVRQERLQFVSQPEQSADALIQFIEALTHERANFPAWRTTFIPHREDVFQIVERESDDEGALNQEHSLDGRRRVLAISRCRTCDSRKESLALVVSERIGADPCRVRDISGPHQRAGHRVRTVVESPVS